MHSPGVLKRGGSNREPADLTPHPASSCSHQPSHLQIRRGQAGVNLTSPPRSTPAEHYYVLCRPARISRNLCRLAALTVSYHPAPVRPYPVPELWVAGWRGMSVPLCAEPACRAWRVCPNGTSPRTPSRFRGCGRACFHGLCRVQETIRRSSRHQEPGGDFEVGFGFAHSSTTRRFPLCLPSRYVVGASR